MLSLFAFIKVLDCQVLLILRDIFFFLDSYAHTYNAQVKKVSVYAYKYLTCISKSYTFLDLYYFYQLQIHIEYDLIVTKLE